MQRKDHATSQETRAYWHSPQDFSLMLVYSNIRKGVCVHVESSQQWKYTAKYIGKLIYRIVTSFRPRSDSTSRRNYYKIVPAQWIIGRPLMQACVSLRVIRIKWIGRTTLIGSSEVTMILLGCFFFIFFYILKSESRSGSRYSLHVSRASRPLNTKASTWTRMTRMKR